MASKTRHLSAAAFSTALIITGLALIVSIILAVSIGQVNVPFLESYRILIYKIFGVDWGSSEEIQGNFASIIWLIRFPRAIMSCLIGMGLALCGVIMQASVQNPLADPYILGVSSGATLGATFAILIGFESIPFLATYGVAAAAFTGAVLATLFVLTAASIGGRITSSKLVLSGVVIQAIFSAFSNIVIFFSSNDQGIRRVAFWSMGSVAQTTWAAIPLVAAVVIGLGAFFLTQSRSLNTMLMGDEAATTLGVNLGRLRKVYLALSSLLTGVMVAECGTIGFVGLIIPHVTRALTGSDHRRLTPLALLVGGLFMVWADIIARSLIPSVEMPIGIITAAIGAPVFMYILLRKGYGFGGN